eukprot:scaffold2.g7107.t1
MQRKSPFRALTPKRVRSDGRRDVAGAGSEEAEGASPRAGSGGASPKADVVSARQGSRTLRFSRRRTRSKQQPAAELPEQEQGDEAFQRDWGITRQREEELLVEFRKRIEAAVGPLKPMFDRYYLRRFLRARQHNLGRAQEMFLAHLKWRAQSDVDAILDDFQFTERDAFLTLYPQGYHKTDKLGRPVYIQHLGSINVRALAEITTEERMLKFHIQEYERCLKYIFPSCSKVAGKHIGQTFAIMDVKGVGIKHLTGDVKRILNVITRTDQDNYPETLGKTVIINAPALFKMVWAVVKPMLDVRTQAKIEVAPTDYMKVLQKWIDIDCIPEYLGGTSKGSLIDDVGPWKDPATHAEVEADIARRDAAASFSAGEELTSDASAPPSPFASGVNEAPAPRRASASPSPAVAEPALSGSEQQQQQQQHPHHQQPATPSGKGCTTSESDIDEFTDARSRHASVMTSYASATEDFSDVDGWQSPQVAAAASPRPGSFGGSDRPLLGSPLPAPRSPAAAPAGAAAPSGRQYSDAYRSPARPDGTQQPQQPPATGAGSTEPGTELSFAAAAQQAGPHSPASVSGKRPESVPSPPQQISILARVRALEEQLPAAERSIRRYLGHDLPSKSVGQGTLLSRVEALERAMDAVVAAQSAVLQDRQRQRAASAEEEGSSCCACCSIM